MYAGNQPLAGSGAAAAQWLVLLHWLLSVG
jgi:hypothetical protein